MTQNKTSQAVDMMHETARWFKGDDGQEIVARAICEKYKRYESYATIQAERGDVEAQKVLEFDPLSQ